MTQPERIAVFSALLLSLQAGSAHAAPRPRDVWHAYVADGKRYGSLHSVVAALPDGNFRITKDSRLLLDVLGANREELTERGEYVVTPDYRPVSISVEGKLSSGAIRVTGRRDGERFEMTATIAGVERSHVFERGQEMIPRACLDDWIADRPASFQAGEVTVIAEELCDASPAKVRKLTTEPGDTGTTWSIDAGPLEGAQRLSLDASGLRREFTVGMGFTLTMKRCSAQEAAQIDYRTVAGRDALMIPLDQDLGALDRLESVTVELRWKDISFDRLRLEDDRQHLVEQSEEGGRYRAVVRIEPPAPLKSAAQLPITGAEMEPYLGESRFIKPRDARIAAQAAALVRGKTDALEIVEALCAWVSKNVEVAMIAETLSGPEVLACRKGKCSEFATLFASLARSAGIPTRIVLGDRLLPSQWGGHMWNEVYVGRWIPIDAGYNEVGKSAALLKFLDTESVEGLIPLRAALPASLQIKILDHRSLPSPLAGRFQTGIAGRVYTNADLSCRMTAPAEDWTIEKKPEGGEAVLRFKVPGKDDIQLHFVPFALPVAMEPKTLLGFRKARYKTVLKNFEVIADEPYTVNGLTGHRLEFRCTAANGKTRHSNEVIWRKPSAGYLLALDAEDSAYNDVKPSFTKLLESFEDLEKKK